MSKDEDLSLKETIKSIKKHYGDGSIMLLGDKPNIDIDVISTGSLLLNDALGIGGYPRGRIIEIFGPESSGKTTLALHAIAEAQKKGENAAFIDAEHSVDPVYAKNLGVDIDKLIFSQPSSGEEALEIAESLAQTGKVSIIVIDSVAALVPQVELDGDMEDNQVGLQARLMSKAMRKLIAILSKTNTIIIFINQLREKVGVFYGNPEITTGGRALKFSASIRLEIRKGDSLKNNNDSGDIVGNVARVRVVKNKVAPPFKTCNIDIIYGQGIVVENEILDIALMKDIIKKNGSWYELDGEKIGQGKENAKLFLKEHKDVTVDLLKKIKEIK